MTLLSKWEPLREIEELFNRPWPWPAGRGSALQGLSDWTPRVDISEDASHYAIKADIPGVAKDDLKVSVDNGMVTIQGDSRRRRRKRPSASTAWSASTAASPAASPCPTTPMPRA